MTEVFKNRKILCVLPLHNNRVLEPENDTFFKCLKSESDVTYGQVWWPILGIRALHLPIQSAHTQQWTHIHTMNTHPEQWAASYAAAPGEQLGVQCLPQGHLVVVLKVERALYIHSPHLQSLPVRDSNPQPFHYKSDSLIIRPRLPPKSTCFWKLKIQKCEFVKMVASCAYILRV